MHQGVPAERLSIEAFMAHRLLKNNANGLMVPLWLVLSDEARAAALEELRHAYEAWRQEESEMWFRRERDGQRFDGLPRHDFKAWIPSAETNKH